MQTGPDKRRTIPTRFPGRARSLRTQQRAYEPNQPPATAFHTPKGRTSSDRRRRPNWSVFHPRALPQTPAATR
jgi:hypothetical protein